MLGGDQKRARSAQIQGTLRRSLEKNHLGARCPFSGPVDLFARSLDRNHTVYYKTALLRRTIEVEGCKTDCKMSLMHYCVWSSSANQHSLGRVPLRVRGPPRK